MTHRGPFQLRTFCDSEKPSPPVSAQPDTHSFTWWFSLVTGLKIPSPSLCLLAEALARRELSLSQRMQGGGAEAWDRFPPNFLPLLGHVFSVCPLVTNLLYNRFPRSLVTAAHCHGREMERAGPAGDQEPGRCSPFPLHARGVRPGLPPGFASLG